MLFSLRVFKEKYDAISPRYIYLSLQNRVDKLNCADSIAWVDYYLGDHNLVCEGIVATCDT